MGGTELENAEFSGILGDAHLPVKDRAGAVQLDRRRQSQQHGGQHQQHRAAHRHVEHALCRQKAALVPQHLAVSFHRFALHAGGKVDARRHGAVASMASRSVAATRSMSSSLKSVCSGSVISCR